MSELYNTEILRLATAIPYLGRLDAPDVSVTRTSRICGSRLIMDACFKDDRISEMGLEVKACALGQAATARIAPKLIGMPVAQIQDGADAFRAMIRDGGPVPPPPFDDLDIFLPLRNHPSRHGSVMLVFEAALTAAEQAGVSAWRADYPSAPA